MATDIMAFVKFRSGVCAPLQKLGAADNGTFEELTTGPQGAQQLNVVSGVSIGQAYSGEVAVAACVIAQKDAAATTGFSGAYFLGPDGKIICTVQGGGYSTSGFAPLAKPVVMQTGVTFQAASQDAQDGVAVATLAVYCTDGTADVFQATAVADTKTSMTNKDGSTFGQALAGKVIDSAYANYNSTKGLNEDGAGVGAFFHESSEGQLKMAFPPSRGLSAYPCPLIPGYGTRVLQNDTLSVTGTT